MKKFHILGNINTTVYSLISAYDQHEFNIYTDNPIQTKKESLFNYITHPTKKYFDVDLHDNNIKIVFDPQYLNNKSDYSYLKLSSKLQPLISVLGHENSLSLKDKLCLKGIYAHRKDDFKVWEGSDYDQDKYFLQAIHQYDEVYKTFLYIDEHSLQVNFNIKQETFGESEEIVAMESANVFFDLTEIKNALKPYRGFFVLNILKDKNNLMLSSIRRSPLPVFNFLKHLNIDIFDLKKDHMIAPGYKLIYETVYYETEN